MSDGDRLAAAVREVATGGSMLDPEIVAALVSPVRRDGDLSDQDEQLLQEVAQGRPVKAIAASRHTTPEAVNAAIESLFVQLAKGVSGRRRGGAAAAAAAAQPPSWIARSRARP